MLHRATLLSFFLITAFVSVRAQDCRGTISGRAADQSGASVANVQVRATNTGTGAGIEATTNDSGNYTLPFLLPGFYNVSAELIGFQKLERKAVEVRVNDSVTVDLRLTVGDVTQSMEVSGSTPLLEIGTVSLGQVFDRDRIADLPIQSDPRVSTHIRHLGIIVGKLNDSMKFYGDILGFTEIWRGSKEGKVLDWVNMKLPDSNDYLEFMLYDQKPDLGRLGTLHHISLEVPDVEKARAQLEGNPAKAIETRPMEIKTGINRKRQMNLYDPDGTRSEVMEPGTIDGKPAPPATAAPLTAQLRGARTNRVAPGSSRAWNLSGLL